DRLALLVVEFDRLLREQLVDVGIAAVGVGATLDDKGFETGGSVAEGGAATHDQALVVFFLGIAFEESSALDRPQINADAGLAQIVDDSLSNIGEGGIAVERAAVDAAGGGRLGPAP